MPPFKIVSRLRVEEVLGTGFHLKLLWYDLASPGLFNFLAFKSFHFLQNVGIQLLLVINVSLVIAEHWRVLKSGTYHLRLWTAVNVLLRVKEKSVCKSLVVVNQWLRSLISQVRQWS